MKKSLILTISAVVFTAPIFVSAEENIDDGAAYWVDRSSQIERIGTLKTRPSSEVKGSKFSIGFEGLDRGYFEPEKAYDMVGATGVKWARCQTAWNLCEKVKGVYDFSMLDSVVDNLRARGIQPWFNVGYGNKLYMPTAPASAVGHVPCNYGDEVLTAWKNFVSALAAHFKNRVTHYEVWNEPNIAQFWAPKGPSAKAYADFVNLTADCILKSDPNAKIGACVSGEVHRFFENFMKNGGGKNLSFFSIHPYRTIPELWHRNITEAARALLKKYAPDRNIELWNGESGFGSYFPKKHFLGTWHRGSQTNQAKWILRRFLCDRADDYGLSSFYQAVDLPDSYATAQGRQLPSKHGLLNRQYQPKISYGAFSRICSLFDESVRPYPIFCKGSFFAVFPNHLRVSRIADVAVEVKTFEKKGYAMFAYWMPEDPQMGYAGQLGFQLSYLDAEKRIKNPVLIDMLTGAVFKPKRVNSDAYNSIVSGLPITDYPLVLTDLQAVQELVETDGN